MSDMRTASRPVRTYLSAWTFPVRIVRMPRCMKDCELMLRQLTIFDGPFLKAMLQSEDVVKSVGLRRQPSGSWVSLWWTMRKTFPLAYCIECDSKRTGFIGLYDIIPGESGRMSLVIFERTLRRKGYGCRSASLFMDMLKERRFVRKIFAEVDPDNHGSLAFWRKIGFGDEPGIQGRTVMSLYLHFSCDK